MQKKRKSADIFGVRLDDITMSESLDLFAEFLDGDSARVLVTPNSEILMSALENPSLYEAISEADLVLPDGVGLLWASRILGTPLRERVAGIDFASEALKILAEREGSVFFLGGRPRAEGENLSVAEKAMRVKLSQNPGLRSAGTRHGYFSSEEEEVLVEEINSSGADVLFVGCGSPKQEIFLQKHRNVLRIKAGIGIGGSFDVWSGRLKRAPEIYRKAGFEWLYRLLQEPSRMGRMKSLPIFLTKVFRHRLLEGRSKG